MGVDVIVPDFDLAAEAERLALCYGAVPSEIGVEDGTEDDYGDLQSEVATLVGIELEDDAQWERFATIFQDCADCGGMLSLLTSVRESVIVEL